MALARPDTAEAHAWLQHHPLQKLASPSRGVSAAIHLAGLASFLYSFHFLVDNPNDINQAFGWHLQYLTIIGLSLATLTFTLGLLADITLSPRLFHFKNALSIASAPLEVLISILYWGISSIDRKLVMPEMAPPLPLEADLGFHAAPALFLAFDALFMSPPWAITVIPAFILSAVTAIAYWIWIEACHTRNGFYPYPIFETTTSNRVGLFVGAAVTMTISTLSFIRLYSVVNGTSILHHDGSRPGKIRKY